MLEKKVGEWGLAKYRLKKDLSFPLVRSFLPTGYCVMVNVLNVVEERKLLQRPHICQVRETSGVCWRIINNINYDSHHM